MMEYPVYARIAITYRMVSHSLSRITYEIETDLISSQNITFSHDYIELISFILYQCFTYLR